MKRSLSVISALLLVFCLTGCLFGGTGEAAPVPVESGSSAYQMPSADTSEDLTDGQAGSSTEDSPAPPFESTASAPEASSELSGETDQQPVIGPGTAAPESQPAGPGAAETTSAKANDQIMTAAPMGNGPEAFQVLSRLSWADTVWADTGDYCHLRIINVTDTGLTFYWHSRIDVWPTCFQSRLCTADFADDTVSCNYTDERGNSGVVRLVITDQAISFDQTIVHSGKYSPIALSLTLLPKPSGTEAFYFEGEKWQDDLGARNQLYAASGGSVYQSLINDYMENTLEITDVSANSVYLLDSHARFYTEAELSGFGKDLIRLFKNEIYARHGYRFGDEDLYRTFLHFTWYYPDFSPENFKENVLNQYEKENLKLLVKLEEK